MFGKMIRFASLAVFGLALTVVPQAKAGLTLTAAGVAEGYQLSVFASGFPSTDFNGVGPISTGYPVGGGVLASSYADGKVYRFATDTDGQTVAANGVASVTNYGAPTGIASANGNIFMALQGTGDIVKIDSNGNYLSTLTSGLGFVTGLTSFGNNLYASNVSTAIFKVDATTGAAVALVGGAFDGLGINFDGSLVFGEAGQHIYGYHTSDGSYANFDSGFISGADGAALGSGGLLGKLIVNTNFGEVWEVDLNTSIQVLIANGGSRGDLVSVDTAGNGSLLLSQSDSIVRLTNDNGGFQGGITTPEPATWATGMLGAAIVAFVARRRTVRG
jgi:hypothetical protein